MLKKTKRVIRNLYYKYLSPITLTLFHLVKKGPSRFTEAVSMPVDENYRGISNVKVYSTDDCLKLPFHLEAVDQKPHLLYYQRFINQSKNNTTQAGVITAKEVLFFVPILYHLYDGKMFQEVLASRLLRLPRIFDAKDMIKLELDLIFSKKVKIKEEAICLFGNWPQNYYHWLIELLPKIQLFEDNQDLNCLPIILPKDAKEFVKETLAVAGYEDQLMFLDNGVYQFQQLHLCTKITEVGITYPESVSWLREKFINVERKIPNKRRLFVSRQDAKERYISNESELELILDKYGFETLALSNYSVSQQALIFQEAEMIVAPHGAGLANLVFADEGTVVVEIFANNLNMTSAMYAIASVRQLNYGYLMGTKDGLGIYINPQKFKEIIELGLSYL